MHISENAFRSTATALLVALTLAQVPTQVHTQAVPAGLVAAYTFDEASGSSVLDASGNNLTGTIAGATRVAGGKFGGALSFNGTSNTVTVNSAAALNLTTGMTLEAWVNPTALGSAWRNVIIKERPGGEVYNLYAHTDTSRPVVYVVRGSAPSSPQDAQGTAAIPANTWTHLAATYDGATLRLYVNGTQVGSRAVTGALVTSTGALRIGGNSIWGEYFAGLIDEVRIYNRALTVTEIQTDMVTPVGTPPLDTTPPTRSNGQPASPLPTGTTQATLSLTTNETATCRYSTSPGVAYSAMATTFANTNALSHSTQVTGLTDGSSVAYQVRCQDTAGNPNVNDFTINVSVNLPGADSVPPTASLTAPANGATISGIVSVTANASDNIGVAGVQFLLDGANLGPEDTTAPYSYSWDTTLATAGSHALVARARDAAGNTTSSAARTVTIASGTLPANFHDEVVIGTGVTYPTAFEFLPDGRMLIAEFTGKIMVVQAGNSTVDATPVLQLTNVISEEVTVGGERGLVNLVADPAFPTNGFIYIFYTSGSPRRDRVSRFTMVGNTASLASEQIIWQSVADSSSTDHHGGGLGFGPDGKLYITTGDNGAPASVQSLTSDHGKILRYNADGTIPADNPFNDGAGSNLDAIWARGLRNPYRFSFDGPTGRMYFGDVGFNSTEEVNVGQAGANYGWPTCEGPCGMSGMKDPIFSYDHDGHDSAVTGGFVYRGSQFPAVYQGKYFFADFAKNFIRYLTLDASGNVTGESFFQPADGSLDSDFDPVMLKQGPDGSLYYIDFGWGWLSTQNPAAIRRIRFVSGNQPPSAVASAQPTSGLAPLSVNFSSAGSVDPENQALTYLWTFGDGAQSTEANPVYVYTLSGAYAVQLSVSDGTNTTQSSVLGVSVGTRPTGAINAPLNGATFKAGDVLAFSGSATDAEDGILPASAYSWMVLFHHDTHVHPALGPLNGVTSGTFTIPSSGHDFSGATSYEFVLTVTDSTGLQNTSSATVSPRKVDLTFTTNPPNLSISVDGVPKPTPFVKDTLVGFQHTIEAPAQVAGSLSYTFSSWSDGGQASHSIAVPDASQTFTATFQSVAVPPVAGLVAAYNFNEASGASVIDSSGNNLTGTITGATRTAGGRFGSALSFNGTSNMVTVNSAAALNLTTGMTLEAWVNPTTLGSAWRNVLMKERANGETYNLYANTNTAGPTIYTVLASAPNTPVSATTATRLTASTWTHLATTYDGTTLRLFVNGTQVATRAQTGAMVTSTGALRIGGNSIWGEYFAGLIDEVRIYNRALSVAEIQTDMNTPVGTPAADSTPPTRSNGQPSGTLSAGTSQATLSLTTNESASCRYAVSPGISYGAMATAFSATGGTAHSTQVTGLTDGTSYTFYVRCQDTATNANTDDFAIAFAIAQPDLTPPGRSNGGPSGTLPFGTTQATLTLTTSEVAACRYSTTQAVAYAAMSQTFATANGTAHSAPVTGLANGGSYAFYVKCQDAASNANPDDFAIAFGVMLSPPPDTTPPVRSSGQPTGVLPAGTTATSLTLTTNENATCRYDSAPGVAYAVMANAFATTGGTSHSTPIVGLTNGGSYSYYARCQDASGNASTDDLTFAFTVAQSTPPPTGLVAAYGFNEASGSAVADSSGNNLNGTVNGATRVATGKFGGALSFNGTSNTVTVSSAAALNLTTGMTLAAWVYPTSLGSAWRNVVIKERPNGESYNLYANTNLSRPTAYIVRSSATSSPVSVEGVAALPLNTWSHLTVTYDNATLRFYVNGTQVATRSISGAMVTSNGALRIGGNNIWGEYFAGMIDEVRIYNRALTAAEVLSDTTRPITP